MHAFGGLWVDSGRRSLVSRRLPRMSTKAVELNVLEDGRKLQLSIAPGSKQWTHTNLTGREAGSLFKSPRLTPQRRFPLFHAATFASPAYQRFGCSFFDVDCSTLDFTLHMLWLVLLASHSSLADDSPTPLAKISALSAPQRRDLPANTTAKDVATRPPRDFASPDASMKRHLTYLQR